MPRLIALVALLLTLAGGGSVAAAATTAAQDATPAAPASSLAAMGYPELPLTATDAGFELPAEVPAGRVLVTLDNRSRYEVAAQFVRLPAGIGIADIASLADAIVTGGELPAWYYDGTWNGGPVAAPGRRAEVVLDLAPGEWVIAQHDRAIPLPSVSFRVTGEAAAPVSAPEADLVVEMGEHLFDFPARLPAGPQVWELTNAGAVEHLIILLTYPGSITKEQAIALSQLTPDAAPPPDLGIDLARVGYAGWMADQSPGVTTWVATDLAPGSYVVFCPVESPGSAVPHSALGMVDVFTVE